jgi:hypothetical protein
MNTDSNSANAVMNPQDNDIIGLINKSPHLNAGDKSYLIQQLQNITPIEKLKLRHALTTDSQPGILINLQNIRKKFQQIETPIVNTNPITQALSNFFDNKPKNKVASNSFLNQPVLLGSPVPTLPKVPITTTTNTPFGKLSEINDLNQLKMLSADHVSFYIHENIEFEVQQFYQKVDTLFEKINNIPQRRDYFLFFLSSPLFKSYVNTGLTALRHPELQPSSIILNTMYQIDPKYLNNTQFQTTANICGYLRGIVGL